MTQAQAVDDLLARLAASHARGGLCGLHGDCIGADADFDAICKRRSIAVKRAPSAERPPCARRRGRADAALRWRRGGGSP